MWAEIRTEIEVGMMEVIEECFCPLAGPYLVASMVARLATVENHDAKVLF